MSTNNKQIVQKSKDILKKLGHDVSNGHLYELFSQLSGFKSWNVAKEKEASFENVIASKENLETKNDGDCSHILDKLEKLADVGLHPCYHTHEGFLIDLTMDFPWGDKERELAKKWLYGPGEERLKRVSAAIEAQGGPSYYEAFKNEDELVENIDIRWKKPINPIPLTKVFKGEWVYAEELTPEILKTLEEFVNNAYTCEKRDVLESHLLHGENLEQGVGSWPVVSLENGKIVLESCYDSRTPQSRLVVSRFKIDKNFRG
jgi:hypothetical protein